MADESWIDLIDAFDLEAHALVEVLDQLGDQDFSLETNCPPWDLRELVVHIGFSSCTSSNPAHLQPPGEVTITAADYYRRTNRDTDTYRATNVDRTQQAARRFPRGVDASDLVRHGWTDARSVLDESDPTTLVGGPHGVERGGQVLDSTALTLRDHLTTRLIALVAHAADVAITLGRDPWTTSEALRYVTPTLCDLLADNTARDRLQADDLRFVLLATGRAPLRDEDRAQLGEASQQFPLLS